MAHDHYDFCYIKRHSEVTETSRCLCYSLKFIAIIRGPHIHIDVFALNMACTTYQRCGHLVMDNRQFDILSRDDDAIVEWREDK